VSCPAGARPHSLLILYGYAEPAPPPRPVTQHPRAISLQTNSEALAVLIPTRNGPRHRGALSRFLGRCGIRSPIIGDPSSPRLRIIILTVVLLGAPALALSTLANPLNDAGGIDAYLYLALIHDPTQILKRFGTTYYSNRIAFTLPNRLYLLALGDWHGYIAMRYTYLCAATASVYGIARSYYSSRIAIFSATLFCFNPLCGTTWTGRQLRIYLSAYI
jgi:hypothetical protein